MSATKTDRAMRWIGRMGPVELRDFAGALGTTMESVATALERHQPTQKWDLMLMDHGGRKITAIKLLRQFTGWGLKESKDAVDRAHIMPILSGLDMEKATQVAAAFRSEGMTINVQAAA